MKHFYTFCLFLVALIAGTTYSPTLESEIVVPIHRLSSTQLKSHQNHYQTNFNNYVSLLKRASRNGRIRYSNSFQQLSFKVLPSLSNVYRMNHSAILEHQKFITCYSLQLLESAFNQTNGYYLYHLQKLLIWFLHFLFYPIKGIISFLIQLSWVLLENAFNWNTATNFIIKNKDPKLLKWI